MKPRLLTAGVVLLALAAGRANAQEDVEVAACQASGLLALKERVKGITDLVLDRDSLSVSKADAKVGATPIKAVLMGQAYIQKNKSGKPYSFLCLIGERGKVELTFFTQK